MIKTRDNVNRNTRKTKRNAIKVTVTVVPIPLISFRLDIDFSLFLFFLLLRRRRRRREVRRRRSGRSWGQRKILHSLLILLAQPIHLLLHHVKAVRQRPNVADHEKLKIHAATFQLVGECCKVVLKQLVLLFRLLDQTLKLRAESEFRKREFKLTKSLRRIGAYQYLSSKVKTYGRSRSGDNFLFVPFSLDEETRAGVSSTIFLFGFSGAAVSSAFTFGLIFIFGFSGSIVILNLETAIFEIRRVSELARV